MAQAWQAEVEDKRHNFSHKHVFNHDGRITAITITKQKHILMCDYENKKLVLYDDNGQFLRHLLLEGSPWDIAISHENVAYITLPTERVVLQVDPDRLYICSKVVANNPDYTVSYASKSASTITQQQGVYIGYHGSGSSFAMLLKGLNLTANFKKNRCTNVLSDKMVTKFHSASLPLDQNPRDFQEIRYLAIVGENCVWKQPTRYGRVSRREFKDLLTPSDICSDDYGHIYVSGQNSHNILRLTKDLMVLDCPFTIGTGIKDPVAMCFSSDYTTFYVVDDFGKRVTVYMVYSVN